MNILFRADASNIIGTGHVIRCLTLAEALKERGCRAVFITRSHQGNLIQLIRKRGFEVIELPVVSYVKSNLTHSHLLGSTIEEDADQTLINIADTCFDWIIVDHYGLDVSWENRLRSKCHRIMVIDDLADRSHDCDVLLDQNFWGKDTLSRYGQLVNKDCDLFLGPRFALLNKAYIELSNKKRIRNYVKKVLVYFGGSDQQNLTKMAIDSIIETGLDLEVEVVLGANYQFENSLTCFLNAKKISFYKNLPELSSLMLGSDLMIGAGGATSWERLMLGLPSIVVSVADNQKLPMGILDNEGVIIYAGDSSKLDIGTLERELTNVLSEPETIKVMSEKCYSFMANYDHSKLINRILGI